jgi:hypothetical protein
MMSTPVGACAGNIAYRMHRMKSDIAELEHSLQELITSLTIMELTKRPVGACPALENRYRQGKTFYEAN